MVVPKKQDFWPRINILKGNFIKKFRRWMIFEKKWFKSMMTKNMVTIFWRRRWKKQFWINHLQVKICSRIRHVDGKVKSSWDVQNPKSSRQKKCSSFFSSGNHIANISLYALTPNTPLAHTSLRIENWIWMISLF